MRDLIDRQAAIDAFYIQAGDDGWWTVTVQDMEEFLKGLPSAEPTYEAVKGGTEMSWDKRCDNCIHSVPDWTNKENSCRYCDNENSDEYGENTEYLFGCDAWEGEEDE